MLLLLLLPLLLLCVVVVLHISLLRFLLFFWCFCCCVVKATSTVSLCPRPQHGSKMAQHGFKLNAAHPTSINAAIWQFLICLFLVVCVASCLFLVVFWLILEHSANEKLPYSNEAGLRYKAYSFRSVCNALLLVRVGDGYNPALVSH